MKQVNTQITLTTRQLLAATICGIIIAGCEAPPKETPQLSAPAPVKSKPVPLPPKPRRTQDDMTPAYKQFPRPIKLLDLDAPAYASRVFLDKHTIYLLTPKKAYRIDEGQQHTVIVDNPGIGATVTESAIVYWQNGTLFSVPKSGGHPLAVAKLPNQPAHFHSSGDQFIWISRTDSGIDQLFTMRQNNVRGFYTSAGQISKVAFSNDTAFFIEFHTEGGWRFGRASLNSSTPTYSVSRDTRPPSTLAIGDALYYYDVPERTIRKLSLDLQTETALIKDVVCSPLKADSRLICARAEGLFEVSLTDGTPRRLTQTSVGRITGLAANDTYVAWLTDAGKKRLALGIQPLP